MILTFSLKLERKMAKIFIIFTLLLMSFHNKSLAIYVDSPIFISLNDKEALSGGIATAILQDQQGFLWVGTQQGLVRYDGYSFVRYQADPNSANSLSDNYIRSMALAKDGRIWVGTLGGGVSIYDPSTDKFSTIKHSPNKPNDPYGLSNNRVDALAVDQQGGVWIGTNKGLNYWSSETEKISQYFHHPKQDNSLNDDHIRALLIDKNNTLWVGSWQGLNQRKATNTHFTNITGGDADFPINETTTLANKNILRLFEAENGVIWFGTPEHGGGQLNNHTLRVTWLPYNDANKANISHPWVTGIAQPNAQTIWLATYGGGINIVDSDSGKIIKNIRHDATLKNSLGSNEIGPLYIDHSGLLWVGTWGAGLNIYNTNNQTFHMFRHSPTDPKSLSHANISSIMEAKNGIIWVGTASNGIDLFSLTSGLLGGFRADKTNKQALGDGSITALVQANDDTVWVGTRQSGLHKYLPQSKNFKRYSVQQGLLNNLVHTLLPVGNHTVWVGSSGGLNRFDVQSERFFTITTQAKPNQAFTEQIDALVIDKQGRLWVGAESGLYVLKAKSNQLIRIKHDNNQANSLSHNDVNALLIDSNNTLWLSSQIRLERLVRWDGQTAIFESISALVGKPNDAISANLIEDELGRIWASASLMIDPTTWTLHHFHQIDGVDLGASWLRANTKLRNGDILYGGSKGLLLITPNHFTPWQLHPPLTVSSLKIDGEKKSAAERITLPADSRSFTVEFSALDYSAPLKNLYQFKLIPYDNDWINTDSSRRIATYTNLDPGNYQLKIRGSNRIGQWSNNTLNIAIIKLPKWYQTYLFKITCTVFLCYSLYLIYVLRVRQLKKSKQQLEIKVKEKTLDLNKKNKQLHQALKEVKEASFIDPLTQLRNRRYFLNSIDTDIAAVNRLKQNNIADEKSDLLFFLFDIDFFKAINDTYGHAAGDAVLVQFAAILKKEFRESDTIIRWGGEEFLAISRYADRNQAAKILERIRLKIANYHFDIGDDRTISKTCSVGYAPYPFIASLPTLVNWQQIIDIADTALYAAKHSNRNAWVGIEGNTSTTSENISQLLSAPVSEVRQQFNIYSSLPNEQDIIWTVNTT